MVKFLKPLVLWVLDSNFAKWFELKFLPHIRFSMYYTSIRGWKYQRGYRLLKPGCFVLTVDKHKATTLLIPGSTWTHAAFCRAKGDYEEWEITEMTHFDTTKSCFFDNCKEADRVSIWFCKDWDETYIEQMIKLDALLSNIPYDTSFKMEDLTDFPAKVAEAIATNSALKLGIKRLACSERVYVLDFERRAHWSLEDVAGLGRPYISPEGLTKADNVFCIWDSDSEVCDKKESKVNNT